MIHARLRDDGRLVAIGHRDAVNPDDVPLDAMPSGFGPWVYDAAARRAVPAPLDADERLERVDLPRRLLAALTLRAWPGSTPAEHSWADGVIASAGRRIREVRMR